MKLLSFNIQINNLSLKLIQLEMKNKDFENNSAENIKFYVSTKFSFKFDKT